MSAATLELYNSLELLAILQDPRLTISTRPWRNFFTPRVITSEQERIGFAEIDARRPVAPLMFANAPGRPIFAEDGMRIEYYRPAYTKPKDAVGAIEAQTQTAEELLRLQPVQSPQSRFNAKILKILRFHDQAIDRRIDLMVAQALLYGKIRLEHYSDAGVLIQSDILDFEREPTLTINDDARRWSSTGFDIFDDIQRTIDQVANAKFGGVVSNVVMGAEAASLFLKSPSIKDKLDTNFRGSEDVAINRGIIRTDPMNPFAYLGSLGAGIDCWRAAGAGNQFQNADLSYSEILNTKDVLFTSPSVDLVEAYGAIMDVSNLFAVPKWPKMWDENDPSQRFVMTQSAPLVIVPQPNGTARQVAIPR